MSSIDGPPSTPEHTITLGDLRHLVLLTGRDLRECVGMFGEDHQHTRTAIRLHAFLSALAAQDTLTEGSRRECFLALGPAPEPRPELDTEPEPGRDAVD